MSLITEVDIIEESKSNFLTYAEEVLTDRALPAVEDGLLSAQRKILWTMEEVMKLNSKSKTKKSNSIVGTTLATSYYHGDASCYGVLCKIAQPFLMRYPLIDGQGSLGTQESNDMVASSRYTEARPHIYGDLMMENFDKNIVPLKPTYNDDYMEPVYLPSAFPNSICNGMNTIAIGMAHSSLPHNLTEACNAIIYCYKNGQIDIDTLLSIMPGPDFPLGGTVINKDAIREGFLTGKTQNTLKIRGNYEIKGNKIIFTSIPYGTYRDKIKEKISKNLENNLDKYIIDFDDESAIGENRLIFTIKKDVSIDSALRAIFKYGGMQTTARYDMNYLVHGTPKLCSMMSLIQYYCEHQEQNLINSTKYDKDLAEKRKHILEALIKAIDIIDETISIIRNSEDKEKASLELQKKLEIDEIQAKAILDIRLVRLTKLNKEELRQELKDKIAFITKCDSILSDKNIRIKILVKKTEEMKNKYGDARRTELTQINDSDEPEEEVYVEPEKVVVQLTQSGLIKRIPTTSFKPQNRNTKGIKSTDEIILDTIRTNTADTLLLFSSTGQMYRLLVDKIPQGTNASKGVSLRSLGINEPITAIYSLYKDTPLTHVLFITKNGLGKRVALNDLTKTRGKSLSATKFRDGDSLVGVSLVKDEDIIFVTKLGQVLRVNSSDITVQSRIGTGTKAVGLKEDDEVVAVLPVRHTTDDLAIFSELGYGKKLPVADFKSQSKGGKGVQGYKVVKTSGNVAAAVLVENTDNVLISGNTNSVCISAADIPVTSRTARGNTMIKDNKIQGVSKV